ncbi:MAG: lasso peptide biosynthesis B2 protein [Gemmatimonadales bacterium]
MSTERSGPVEYGVWVSAPGAEGAATDAGGLRVLSVLWCGLVITWIKLLLRVVGFRGTLSWIRRRVERIPATADVNIERVRAVEYAVAMAGALYIGRAKCLEQSLTLYYMLRRKGVAVKYYQGVQPYPFQAHAWVEYRSEVINDVEEHARFFARLPEQLP